MSFVHNQADLGKRWGAFFSAVLDPWVLLLALTSFLSGAAAVKATPELATALLTLLSSLSSGLLGGRVVQRWGAEIEENIVAARGKSAVRGLKLHLRSVADLESRARVFLRRHLSATKTQGAEPLPADMALEEIVGRCRLLEEQVLSSIENWTDIVPEADIRTQIGEITKLAAEVDTLSEAVEAARAEIEETKTAGAAAQDAAKKELSRKERELTEARKALATRSVDLGQLTIGSPLGYTGSLVVGGGVFGTKTCAKCGKSYSDPPNIIRIGSVCSECAGQ